MTDLDAIIQAAEEVAHEAADGVTEPTFDYEKQVAFRTTQAAFEVFIAKLKALRQGIYG